ncbi:MAG: metallophosphoesterase [Alphaproteobacteria bacterium]|nr:metallophosphoesterase [Alphaproteobacteria bacterium]
MGAFRLGLGVALWLGAMPAVVLAEDYRWVQMVPGGGVEARVVTTASTCPEAHLDGQAVAMTVRAEPLPPDFPVRVCTLTLPHDTRTASIGGEKLALPVATPSRIIVVGDTGCRITKSARQNCDKNWPWREIADTAANTKPDLVIHVGDYLYRESRCPWFAGDCTNGPSGDTWATWEADYFAPARSLMAVAPMVLVRGNHEICGRGGVGWMRLLDPYPFDNAVPCRISSAPYTVPLDRVTMAVMDVADDNSNVHGQLAAVARMTPHPAWILLHRPFRAAAPFGSTYSLGAVAIPDTVTMALAGHIHAFEALSFRGQPAEIVVGNSGTSLDVVGTNNKMLDGWQVETNVNVIGFGFTLLEKAGDDWVAHVFDASGIERESCRVHGRELDCRAVHET